MLLSAREQDKIPFEVFHVCHQLKEAGFSAYVVGGGLRDLILGREPKDWDVATSATPAVVQELFPRNIPTGVKHGTVTVFSGETGLPVEVTTFRVDAGYGDGRHPDEVKFVGDIVLDLGRRDFTINAMALDMMTGTMIDPYGGIEDLKAGLIRCVGNPAQRLTEDGLRRMRAIRFACQLEFAIDFETQMALRALGPSPEISMERKRVELEKILMSRHPSYGFNLLLQSGILEDLLNPQSEIEPRHRIVPLLDQLPADLPLRLAGFFYAAREVPTERDLKRLTFSNSVIARTLPLTKISTLPYSLLSSYAVRHWASTLPNLGSALQALQLAEVFGLRDSTDAARSMLEKRPPLYIRDLVLDGHQVAEITGLKGEEIGSALRYLMFVVLQRPEYNTIEKLTSLLNTPRWMDAKDAQLSNRADGPGTEALQGEAREHLPVQHLPDGQDP